MTLSLPNIPLVCPRCRHADSEGKLHRFHLHDQQGNTALAGQLDHTSALQCGNPHCSASYPVFDGIACIFSQPGYIAAQPGPLDLTAHSATALATALSGAPGESPLVTQASRVYRYAWAGFHDWIRDEHGVPLCTPVTTGVHTVELLDWLKALEQSELNERPAAEAGAEGAGLLVSAGAASCREAWEWDGGVLALDAHFGSLQFGKRLHVAGSASLPVPAGADRWRVASVEPPEGVEPSGCGWVCCNVADPPFDANVADVLVAANLLDSTTTPWVVLGQCAALTRQRGTLMLSTPWAWRDDITERGQRPQHLTGAQSEAEALTQLAGELGLAPVSQRDFTWSMRASETEATVYSSTGFAFR